MPPDDLEKRVYRFTEFPFKGRDAVQFGDWHHTFQRNLFPSFSRTPTWPLKMKTKPSSKRWNHSLKAAHISEDQNSELRCSENIKTCTLVEFDCFPEILGTAHPVLLTLWLLES